MSPKKRIDGRRFEARELKRYFVKFMGATNAKSPELCKMAAGLAVRLDLANEKLARGEFSDDNNYGRLVNSLGRCLDSLGLSSWLNADPPVQPKKPGISELLKAKAPNEN